MTVSIFEAIQLTSNSSIKVAPYIVRGVFVDTDTLLISDLADATLYVTRSGHTEKGFIKFINDSKEGSKILNVGLIVNDVANNDMGYGNKFGYGYGKTNQTFFEKLRSRF